MNAFAMAQRSYSAATTPIKTPRSVEYELFSKITKRLCETAKQRKSKLPAFLEALEQNRKFWGILAVDVASPENALPKELRAQIFYLAEFTEIHTGRIIQHGASVAALIDINTAILRGLKDGIAKK